MELGALLDEYMDAVYAIDTALQSQRGGDSRRRLRRLILSILYPEYRVVAKSKEFVVALMTGMGRTYYVEEVRGPGGEKYQVKIEREWSAYDVLEMVTCILIASSKDARKELAEALADDILSSVVVRGGRRMSVRELLEEKGVSVEEFKRRVHEYVEVKLLEYINDINSVRGSPLARHIVLREKALNGNTDLAWLAVVAASFTGALLLLRGMSLTRYAIDRVTEGLGRVALRSKYVSGDETKIMEKMCEGYEKAVMNIGARLLRQKPNEMKKVYRDVRHTVEKLIERFVHVAEPVRKQVLQRAASMVGLAPRSVLSGLAHRIVSDHQVDTVEEETYIGTS